jgi:AbrB family looped-hinge helix DNA binding protein
MTYEATLTSKGQVTIPAEVRDKLNLKEGDKIEFYFDLRDRLVVRPRNLSPTAVLDRAPKRKMPPRTMTDDEAIAAAIADKDRRSKRRRAA